MRIDGEYVGHLNHITTRSGSCRRSARLLSAPIHVQGQSTRPPEALAEVKAPSLPYRKAKRRKVEETPLDVVLTPQAPHSTEDYREVLEDDEEKDLDFTPTAKPKRRRQPEADPVYVIADVEKKQTTFEGRLGYACLNTVLRNKKPATDSVFCSRTCRLDSLKKNGIEFVKDLGRKNVEDLLTIIQWNEDNNIRFFRLSSEMFPYASHGTYGYTLDYCSELLAKAGALANQYGHRLTTHPGQFTQLGSPKPLVVEAAVRELTYHCQMLDMMGMGPDSVMIIHGGGVYNDKPRTLERLKQSIMDLPLKVRQRLVLENDEMCYNAEDLLPVCEELDVPFVFDYHHDNLFPSSLSPATIIDRANVIFSRRGIKPKQHLSEPRPGAVTIMERRAHADRCENLPPDLPDDMDLMIEAKDKEQAVFYLYRMYDLQPVIHESLRPATENPSMHTNGRKSTKRARAKVLKEATVEDESE
ncbi:hypothetical protein HYPSUDRAFT_35030 [Hypholoma sublateritium FD-334 SS-4]|uniref:UV-endonuclease UvdE n=1 Tax=Hypholoma sublateritium (strain FD-334 SS-4) TaxID=945553 RepID=A0A0D2LJI8_HYPSF|nr:hypothetical protein HYPSUDRAFT_35030 [Hypholoma sublateritium FD-334 SS-4]